MKAVAIVGSPRKKGNTEILTRHALKAVAEEGLGTELIRLAGMDIQPCTACMVCLDEERCPIKDDLFPLYLDIKEVEAIILASPVYFGSATAQLKAFMDRVGFIGYRRRVFAGKVGRPLVVAPGGAEFYLRSDYALVSYSGILYAWFNILEYCLWSGGGRG